jgi:hypothetical protein
VTEIVAVASVLREVRDDLRRNDAFRAQVEDHEHRIEALSTSAPADTVTAPLRPRATL